MSDLDNLAYNFVTILYDKYTESNNGIVFMPLLVGIPPYELKGYGVLGGTKHNPYIAVDAIHKYYKNNKGSDIDFAFESCLIKMIEAASRFSDIKIVTDVILYQLKKESLEKDAFIINRDIIIKLLNLKLKENRDVFRKNDIAFIGWIANISEYAKKFDVVISDR